ncbi:unnamed protein product [Acanthoscelides obtectus]|uniref:DUF4817 domain-containing protein n=1 Tax=Acanthoscelides obtectus TaxID=200917 RepID=A0A9P0MDW3_ACAOB|nr:unnamed protein product [Acanthoscelides obtectus]CAK1651333.1 hypothetical protein AOBTE_LOCUS17194 [Acanthoscelides obtectus]
MNHYTPKQRAEIVTMYIENRRSIVLTQRAYRRKYRGKQAPSDNTTRSLIVKIPFNNDQGVLMNCLKRSETALPRTQKCRIVTALSILASLEPHSGAFWRMI